MMTSPWTPSCGSLQELETVHARHLDVRHDQIVRNALHMGQSVLAVHGKGDLVPLVAEDRVEQLTGPFFIVDHEIFISSPARRIEYSNKYHKNIESSR